VLVCLFFPARKILEGRGNRRGKSQGTAHTPLPHPQELDSGTVLWQGSALALQPRTGVFLWVLGSPDSRLTSMILP
jgi:hypothetical protein